MTAALAGLYQQQLQNGSEMRVLVTGGSGFIAAHCLDQLLAHGHEVVTTVRSDAKGQLFLDSHRGKKLLYVIVEDIVQEGAFNEAFLSNPPFDAVLHIASPFRLNVTELKKDLLDPAIMGTVAILKAIKTLAPSVKRVAITSSFAAIVNPSNHAKVYNEEMWNPITFDQAIQKPTAAYQGGKTFAEKAAWEFVEEEQPNFQISTLNPPTVFGPVVYSLNSLENINTSNQKILDIIQGKMKEKVAPTAGWLWVDVRDVALAHVRAIELPEAAGKRFFIVAGHHTNEEIVEIIREGFPDLRQNLPENTQSDLPKDVYQYDNCRSTEILGLHYRSFRESVVDTVKSLQAVGD